MYYILFNYEHKIEIPLSNYDQNSTPFTESVFRNGFTIFILVFSRYNKHFKIIIMLVL